MKWVQTKPRMPYEESDSIIEKLAKIRGIDDIDEFLKPTEKSLHDPYTLKNIEIVRNKILNAIHNHDKISVLFDQDSDGNCSGAIVYNFLIHFTDNVEAFCSDKTKSHGLSSAIEKVPQDTQLLIIVDSSTSDAEACKRIGETGIDIVILDHHPKSENNSYATIVNPQLDNYPNKELSGSALCWKVMCVLDDTLGSGYSEELIDLAGIGLISDVMSMREPENRYIVHKALANINNPGLKAIFKSAKKDLKNLSTTDIGFSISPLINSAIRLGRMDIIMELLTTDDFEHAYSLTKKINKLNNARKKMQKKTLEVLSEEINTDDRVIVVVNDEIDPGIRGLIAADLASKYQRPALVLKQTENGMFEGSGRSYGSFDLKEFLSEINECVDYAQGHSQAMGVGIYEDKLESFKREVNKRLKDNKKERFVFYDLELDADDVTMSLIEDIMRFNRISGKDMYEAKFKVNNLMIMEKRILGKNADTIKIECDVLDLMKFRTNEEYLNELPGEYETIEAVGSLNINRYFNFGSKEWVVSNQMFMDDIRVS